MGKVYLIGAGPGDCELITIKGLRYIQQCDVVLYDKLVSNTFKKYVKPDCKLIFVGKEAGAHSKTQEEINQILVEAATTYENVVRLKGGDPFVFGRGGEEIETLVSHHIPFEVIPGISSAIGALSSVGIPVTHRGLSQSFHVICGHTSDTEDHLTEDYEYLAKLKGTLVFLMGLGRISLITYKLMAHGMAADTPAAVISKGTMKDSKVIRGNLQTIGSLVKESRLTSPAIIVIGQTAHCKFIWKDSSEKPTPLKDCQIGIIGTERIRNKLINRLSEEGAIAHTLMELEVIRTPEIETLSELLKDIKSFHWIAFTSQNGVKTFFQWLREQYIDIRSIVHLKFAVIGIGTRDCLYEYGIRADYVSNISTAEGLGRNLSAIMKADERLLIPRAKQGSKVLVEILDNAKIDYVEVSIYDVLAKETIENPYSEVELDWCIFCSASAVHSYYLRKQSSLSDIVEKEALEKELSEKEVTEKVLSEREVAEREVVEKEVVEKEAFEKKMVEMKSIAYECERVACIGEITAEALRRYGVEPHIVASISTVEEIVEGIKAYEEKCRSVRQKEDM